MSSKRWLFVKDWSAAVTLELTLTGHSNAPKPPSLAAQAGFQVRKGDRCCCDSIPGLPFAIQRS